MAALRSNWIPFTKLLLFTWLFFFFFLNCCPSEPFEMCYETICCCCCSTNCWCLFFFSVLFLFYSFATTRDLCCSHLEGETQQRNNTVVPAAPPFGSRIKKLHRCKVAHWKQQANLFTNSWCFMCSAKVHKKQQWSWETFKSWKHIFSAIYQRTALVHSLILSVETCL